MTAVAFFSTDGESPINAEDDPTGIHGSGIIEVNGSGVGFRGSDWSYYIPSPEVHSTTFVTDKSGTIEYREILPIIKKGISLCGSKTWNYTGQSLLSIPNRDATLGVNLYDNASVGTWNTRLYIYPSGQPNTGFPSGLYVYAAELVNLNSTSGAAYLAGSGDSEWQLMTGSNYLPLSSSPGYQGEYGGEKSGIREYYSVDHHWYVAIAVENSGYIPTHQRNYFFDVRFETDFWNFGDTPPTPTGDEGGGPF